MRDHPDRREPPDAAMPSQCWTCHGECVVCGQECPDCDGKGERHLTDDEMRQLARGEA